MRKELRQHQNTLVIIGTGVMVFSIWSVIRTIMNLVLNHQYLQLLQDAYGADINLIGLHVPLILILAIDLGFRLFVGHSARTMGKEGTRWTACIAGTIVLIVIGALSISRMIMAFRLDTQILNDLITLFIDVTSFVLLIELLVSAVKVKHMTAAGDQAKKGA